MATLELARSKRNAVQKTEEYYNSLYTNIQLSGEDLKVVAITSVHPGEGKSTTSTNLSIAFARAGYTTLLIDADIRSSVMLGTFKPRMRITGLTDYLSGGADLSEGLCDTGIDNLFVISSGKASPNPTALLQSKNFTSMLETFRKYYDYIVVDTPPVGLVADATIISKRCDASLLVAESGRVKRKAVQKAKEKLERTGIPFLGVVLNRFDTEPEKYRSYGRYGVYSDCGKQ